MLKQKRAFYFDRQFRGSFCTAPLIDYLACGCVISDSIAIAIVQDSKAAVIYYIER